MFELRERDREDDSGLGWAGADTPATPSTRPSSFVRLDARSRAVSAALGRAWKKTGPAPLLDGVHRRDVALKIPPDAMWNALAQRYTQDQLVECVLIVGNYTQLAMFQTTLGARLPLKIEGRPDSAVTR